jgi:Protein of unknown function (DUF3570)
MKKKYLFFGLFAVYSIYGFGQTNIRPYTKKKIGKSIIEVVYGHYIQNGNHSAVTGGTGTEKLQVYSPEFTVTRQMDSITSYSYNLGVDIISSASTDKIDFVTSSASKNDNHGYLNLGYNRKLKRHQNITLGGTVSASIESDYLSKGAGLSFSTTSKDKQREFSASVETFLDDLRWGRLNGIKPYRLVYPVELRTINWFREYRRNSYNLNLGFQQVINEKTILGIYPGVQYQEGLLSTPFHRVYFNDNSLKVEKFPDHRIKIPVGFRLNTYLGGKYFLKNYYRFYWDDFGILAHTFKTELVMKLTPAIVLTPQLRFYTQNGCSFFKQFKQHNPGQEFYTSDYDLSSFQSYECGFEARFAGGGQTDLHPYINHFTMRYAWYKRSDGLHAHIITLVLSMSDTKNKKRENLFEQSQ